MNASQAQSTSGESRIVEGFWGVRYQVKEIARSVAFYKQLGFKVEREFPPSFASVSIDGMTLILSGPGTSGARPMPDGRKQEPGGWNRIMLRVKNLAETVDALKTSGVPFRNELESGPGGKQIQIEDPDGNPIELFEPGPGS